MAEFDLLQNRPSADAGWQSSRIVERIDGGETPAGSIANRDSSQFVFLPVADLKRIETAPDETPDVLFQIDIGVPLGEPSLTTMLVEQRDTSVVGNQRTGLNAESPVIAFQEISLVPRKTIDIAVDSNRLTSPTAGASRLVNELAGPSVTVSEAGIGVGQTDSLGRHSQRHPCPLSWQVRARFDLVNDDDIFGKSFGSFQLSPDSVIAEKEGGGSFFR